MTFTRTSLALFCKVVDNYGDIGICWRLARQLREEHEVAVTLWVDDLRSFKQICPEVVLDVDVQSIVGVTVVHWRDQEGEFSPDEIPDIVIEFFGCDIPSGYITAMARRTPRPVWLNLEGLSAEEWVEGCHALPSPHPRLPITKHFFFPGFTNKTGGLLRERGLEARRLAFQSDPRSVGAFLSRLGVTGGEMAGLRVSLFCYPYAPVAELFDAWRGSNEPVTCLVPQGVAVEQVRAFLDAQAEPGTARTRGGLSVRVIPFVAQPDYDKLLWACDLNFVRGEDSFVRAQWAGKPFVWHIYKQDENLHHKKLRAFLQRYSPDIDALNDFSLRWNGADGEDRECAWPALWSSLRDQMPRLKDRAEDWQQQMLTNGDLASNLLAFAALLRQGAEENKV